MFALRIQVIFLPLLLLIGVSTVYSFEEGDERRIVLGEAIRQGAPGWVLLKPAEQGVHQGWFVLANAGTATWDFVEFSSSSRAGTISSVHNTSRLDLIWLEWERSMSQGESARLFFLEPVSKRDLKSEFWNERSYEISLHQDQMVFDLMHSTDEEEPIVKNRRLFRSSNFFDLILFLERRLARIAPRLENHSSLLFLALTQWVRQRDADGWEPPFQEESLLHHKKSLLVPAHSLLRVIEEALKFNPQGSVIPFPSPSVLSSLEQTTRDFLSYLESEPISETPWHVLDQWFSSSNKLLDFYFQEYGHGPSSMKNLSISSLEDYERNVFLFFLHTRLRPVLDEQVEDDLVRAFRNLETIPLVKDGSTPNHQGVIHLIRLFRLASRVLISAQVFLLDNISFELYSKKKLSGTPINAEALRWLVEVKSLNLSDAQRSHVRVLSNWVRSRGNRPSLPLEGPRFK